jgi:predicted NAD/FAD-binding protein
MAYSMRVAVIGSGISGLGAAYLLREHCDVTLFEAQERAGGHARTLTVECDGQPVSVDTGFIVFNYRNYPLLTALFDELDVPVEKSDMSLGLSLENGAFEWGCQGLRAVFAQPSNMLRPAFWGMLRDIMRFNRHALNAVGDDQTLSLGGLLERGTGFGTGFYCQPPERSGVLHRNRFWIFLRIVF